MQRLTRAYRRPEEKLERGAWAEPGIIEAIESTGAPGTPGHGWPAVGVQWHPEVVEAIATDRLLFDEFVTLCADWKKG